MGVDHAWGRSGGWETRAQAASCSGRAAAVVMVTRRRRRAVRRAGIHARKDYCYSDAPTALCSTAGRGHPLACGWELRPLGAPVPDFL